MNRLSPLLRKVRCVFVAAAICHAGMAAAATPAETVKAIGKAAAESNYDEALKSIATGEGEGHDGAYSLQKAKKLAASLALQPEVVAEKQEGDCAVVILRRKSGERMMIDPLYLFRDETGAWRASPFMNWRKLDLTAERKAALEKLEAWYDAEEAKLSGSSAEWP